MQTRNRIYLQSESRRVEIGMTDEAISCRQQPRNSQNDYTKIRDTNFKTENISKNDEDKIIH